MAIDWKKLFGDTASYPDDVKITIAGEEVTLKDLRAHNTATHGETLKTLTEREAKLNERETRTTAATQRLADIVETVSKTTGMTFEQIIAGDTAAAQAAAAAVRDRANKEGIRATGDGKIDWDTDPIYSPVQARLKPIEANQVGLTNAFKAGIKALQDDRSELAWLRFKVDNPDLAKKLKYEDAVKLAVDSNYKDEYGFPDIRKALSDLSGPVVQGDATAAAKAEGEKAGYERARAELAGSVGMPAGGGTAGLEFQPSPAANAGKVTSIAEALNKAIQDPDILRGVTGPVQ